MRLSLRGLIIAARFIWRLPEADLDRVLTSAARLFVSKYAPYLMIHCIGVPLCYICCICYRVAALVWRCLLGIAQVYLHELCHPVSILVGRRGAESYIPPLLENS